MSNRIFLSLLLVLALAVPAAAMNERTVMLHWVSNDDESTALINSHIAALKGLVAKASAPNAHDVVVLFDGMR